MTPILILGAKSDIAKAISKRYASQGCDLILAARDVKSLSEFAEDLKASSKISVDLKEFDALDIASHETFIRSLKIQLHGIICCVGYLGIQQQAQEDTAERLKIIQTNYTGCISIIEVCIPALKSDVDSFIIGISSVAGDRGRASNYFYGSAKAGFTAYLSGLRARLKTQNIHVLTVKPGFVQTKMTAHLTLAPLLTTTPELVANKVIAAQQSKKNVLYVKWIWRYIMIVIKLIPEFIFKRLQL